MGAIPNKRLIAVVGPTASGKSDLALRLALACDGEIVSADSRQVYRYMDAGTAKPSPEDRARVRHWLIDVVDPDEEFSLAQYLDLAREALEDIWRRGKTPFLVGGTGQYVWALLEGWQVPRVSPNRDLRRSLEERAEREGIDSLYRELAAIDTRRCGANRPAERAARRSGAGGQPPDRRVDTITPNEVAAGLPAAYPSYRQAARRALQAHR